MHSVGMVLHPQRDSAEAVEAVLGWATRNDTTVYGIGNEIARLNCAATSVTARKLRSPTIWVWKRFSTRKAFPITPTTGRLIAKIPLSSSCARIFRVGP